MNNWSPYALLKGNSDELAHNFFYCQYVMLNRRNKTIFTHANVLPCWHDREPAGKPGQNFQTDPLLSENFSTNSPFCVQVSTSFDHVEPFSLLQKSLQPFSDPNMKRSQLFLAVFTPANLD